VPVQYSYTSTPPMGRTACTEPQCLYSTAIPLFPLLAVRPVQSLSACTVQLYLYSPYWPCDLYRASVPVQYNYTSTPPIGRAACTEPQYLYIRAISLPQCRVLYNGALYLHLNAHVWSHLTRFFFEWEIFQTKAADIIKTRISCSVTFFFLFSKIVPFMI